MESELMRQLFVGDASSVVEEAPLSHSAVLVLLHGRASDPPERSIPIGEEASAKLFYNTARLQQQGGFSAGFLRIILHWRGTTGPGTAAPEIKSQSWSEAIHTRGLKERHQW
jgi:hypothetical protein